MNNSSRRNSLSYIISDVELLDDKIVGVYEKLIESFERHLLLYKRLHNDSEMDAIYLQQMRDYYFDVGDFDNAVTRQETNFL